MNRKQLEEEILASGLSYTDTQTLLWYLGLCKTSSEWRAFARCDFVSTGPYSYQCQRRWYVTDTLILFLGVLNLLPHLKIAIWRIS